MSHSLMERFIEHHKLIRYNPVTRELAIKNWGKDNLHKGGKPVMDSIKARVNGKMETVRYLLVDTPESKNPDKCIQPYAVGSNK